MTTACFRQSLWTKCCDVTVGFPPLSKVKTITAQSCR